MREKVKDGDGPVGFLINQNFSENLPIRYVDSVY